MDKIQELIEKLENELKNTDSQALMHYFINIIKDLKQLQPQEPVKTLEELGFKKIEAWQRFETYDEQGDMKQRAEFNKEDWEDEYFSTVEVDGEYTKEELLAIINMMPDKEGNDEKFKSDQK